MTATIETRQTRKLRETTRQRVGSRRMRRVPFTARQEPKARILEETVNEPACGKWSCRKCSCSKYEGTEEGGYKCRKCNHYYEDHRES